MLHVYYPPQCWSFICLEPLQVFACCFNCWVHMCKCPSEFGKHYYLVIIHHPREGLKKETRQSVSSKYRQHPWKRQMEKREIQDICNGGWQAAAWVWDCEAVEKEWTSPEGLESILSDKQQMWVQSIPGLLCPRAGCNRYKC